MTHKRQAFSRSSLGIGESRDQFSQTVIKLSMTIYDISVNPQYYLCWQYTSSSTSISHTYEDSLAKDVGQ
jgi:hypothetical protein